MVLIAALAYVLSGQVGGIATVLPMLGALAIGAQRLLPALQHVYYSWAMIAGSHASLDDIIALLDQPLPEEKQQLPLSLFLLRTPFDLKLCATVIPAMDLGYWKIST